MKRLILSAGVIVLSAVLALPCFAQITPGRSSASLFLGGYSFDKDMPLKKNNIVFGFRLGHDFTERWAAEGAFDYVPAKAKNVSGDVNAYGARLDALYHFFPTEKLVPFLAAGVGATMIDYIKAINENGNDFLFNYGGGVKYFLSDDWALRADLRHLLVFDGGRQDWEYTIGLTYFFGEAKSAPKDVDTDGDGVPDSFDKCPGTLKGMQVDKNGCLVAEDGDGDGVPDSLDKCPNTPKGVKVDSVGCPSDSDKDGVADHLDKCPNTPKGVSVDKAGCPLPKKVSIALEIQFASGKTAIQAQYNNQIKKVADFMTEYPGTTAVIEGHTDNVGSESSNSALSQKRAESVKANLVEKHGIAASRLSAKGFGSSQPVADNATAEGRQKNRRIAAVIETMK